MGKRRLEQTDRAVLVDHVDNTDHTARANRVRLGACCFLPLRRSDC